MNVLGIDPSLTATALCTVSGAVSPVLAVSRTKPQAGTPAKLARLRAQRAAVLAAAVHADLVVIEAPSFGSQGSATRDLAGLWWLMVDALIGMGYPLGVVPPSVLKKWTTGTGNASKFVVGQHIARRWPAVALGSDDEADALCLASIGLHRLGALPWEPNAIQVEQLGRVEWLPTVPTDPPYDRQGPQLPPVTYPKERSHAR